MIKSAFLATRGSELLIAHSELPTLRSLCATKKMSKKKKAQLASERHKLAAEKGKVKGDKLKAKIAKSSSTLAVDDVGGGDGSKGKDGKPGHEKTMSGWADEHPKATLDDFDLLKVIGR